MVWRRKRREAEARRRLCLVEMMEARMWKTEVWRRVMIMAAAAAREGKDRDRAMGVARVMAEEEMEEETEWTEGEKEEETGKGTEKGTEERTEEGTEETIDGIRSTSRVTR